jgi:hypothetical protein
VADVLLSSVMKMRAEAEIIPSFVFNGKTMIRFMAKLRAIVVMAQIPADVAPGHR